MASTKGFPNIPVESSSGLRCFLLRVLETLERLTGSRGSKLDQAVTYQGLIDLGLIDEDDI